MTKKHFIRFAALLKADIDETARRFPQDAKRTYDAAAYAASTFARVAAEDNPRFNHDRFMQACGLKDGK